MFPGQTRNEIYPAWSGSAPVSSWLNMPKTPPQGDVWGHPDQMPEPPELSPIDVEELIIPSLRLSLATQLDARVSQPSSML